MIFDGRLIGGANINDAVNRLRPVMLDAVSICVQYDVGGTDIFCTDDLRHRQHNGRYENYFSKRLQRSSRQKQRGAPLGDHTLRI